MTKEEKKIITHRKVITTPVASDSDLDFGVSEEIKPTLDLTDTTDRTIIAKSLGSLFCEGPNKLCVEKNYVGKVVTLCDETLETKFEREELRELLECRNPDFTAEELDDLLRYRIKKRRKNCIDITALPKGNFRLDINKDFLAVPQPVSVFASGDLETHRVTSFKSDSQHFVISRTLSRTLITDLSTKLMVVAKGKPIGCNKYALTNRGSTKYNVKPLDVPAEDSVNITQCYLGSYSHSGTYAIDLSMNVDDNLLAVKPGVVVKLDEGSGVHCESYFGDLRLRWFKVYLDGQLVNSRLRPCTSNACEYSSLPKVCQINRAANKVLVRHADNTYSSYIHMKKENNDVEVGSIVNRGDIVGQVGISGWLTGAHLHFETEELITTENSSIFRSFPVNFSVSEHEKSVYPCRDVNTLSPAR